MQLAPSSFGDLYSFICLECKQNASAGAVLLCVCVLGSKQYPKHMHCLLCHVSPAHATLHECTAPLCLQLSVRLLAIKGVASRDVIMTCLSHDIIVVDQIGTEKLVRLSEASGSEILSYAQHADEVRDLSLLISPNLCEDHMFEYVQHFRGFSSQL